MVGRSSSILTRSAAPRERAMIEIRITDTGVPIERAIRDHFGEHTTRDTVLVTLPDGSSAQFEVTTTERVSVRRVDPPSRDHG